MKICCYVGDPVVNYVYFCAFWVVIMSSIGNRYLSQTKQGQKESIRAVWDPVEL
jgi:hypothetical protein